MPQCQTYLEIRIAQIHLKINLFKLHHLGDHQDVEVTMES